MQISGGSIYYLSFVSWVKDDIMDKHFDLNTGKLREQEEEPAQTPTDNNTIQIDTEPDSTAHLEPVDEATELTLAENERKEKQELA